MKTKIDAKTYLELEADRMFRSNQLSTDEKKAKMVAWRKKQKEMHWLKPITIKSYSDTGYSHK